MQQFEYRVVPTPRKPKSAKGVKGTEARFAHALSSLMNEMALEGWEYVRADTLPCEERSGLTGKTVKYHSMLVFRRALASAAAQMQDGAVAAPVAAAAAPVAAAAAAPVMASEPAQGPAAEETLPIPEELYSHGADRVEPVLHRPDPDGSEQDQEREWDEDDSPLAAAVRGQNR